MKKKLSRLKLFLIAVNQWSTEGYGMGEVNAQKPLKNRVMRNLVPRYRLNFVYTSIGEILCSDFSHVNHILRISKVIYARISKEHTDQMSIC